MQTDIDTPIDYYLKARDSFHISRPYGIRIDYARKEYVLFNRQMNLLGRKSPGTIESLPMQQFSEVEDIPINGANRIRSGNTLDIFFYTDQTDPFIQTAPNLEYLRLYNQYIYPLSLVLNRSL